MTAVLASLLVARLLTPMMAAHMMKAHPDPETDGRFKLWYLRTVRLCLANRWKTLGIATAFFFLSISLVPFMSTGLVPPGNYGFSVVQIELAPGATLRETTDVAEQVRKRLMQFPDVVQCYTTVGAGGSNGFQASAGAVRKATLTLQLLPHKKQKRTQAEFEAEASKALRDFPGVRLSFGTGGFGEKLQISLAGDDATLLADAAQRVEHDVRDSGLANVTSSSEPRAAGDRDPAGAGACCRARRLHRSVERGHPHRDRRRRVDEPAEVQPAGAADSDPRATQ